MELNVIHNTDSLSGLRLLPDMSLDCIVTLPRPCWMRHYGIGEVMCRIRSIIYFLKNNI